MTAPVAGPAAALIVGALLFAAAQPAAADPHYDVCGDTGGAGRASFELTSDSPGEVELRLSSEGGRTRDTLVVTYVDDPDHEDTPAPQDDPNPHDWEGIAVAGGGGCSGGAPLGTAPAALLVALALVWLRRRRDGVTQARAR